MAPRGRRRPSKESFDNRSLSGGSALYYVRNYLAVVHGRLRFTQETLYDECTKIEAQRRPPSGGLSFANVNGRKYKEKKIRRIEDMNDDNSNVVTTWDLAVCALAFGLPESFFKDTYKDRQHLEAEYAHFTNSSTHLNPTIASTICYRPIGLRQIPISEPIPDSRRIASSHIAKLLAATATGTSSLTIIEGRTGVGKSFFIGHFARDEAGHLFNGKAICVDCSDISLDQIVPTLELHLERLHSITAHSTPDNQATLIVLDGLRAQRFANSIRLVDATSWQRPKLQELTEILRTIFSLLPRCAVMVAIENNGRPVDRELISREIPHEVSLNHVELTQLSNKDGSELLSDLGLADIDEALREQLCEKLHGMPLAIRAAAADLIDLEPDQREYMASNLISGLDENRGGDGLGDFEAFFWKSMGRLERDGIRWSHTADASCHAPDPAGSIDPHPLALLRLLALMRGPISKSQLTELISPKKINRLKNFHISASMASIPFILVSEDTLDVHALVRTILRKQMQKWIETEVFENTSSRSELEWIHWKSSVLKLQEFTEVDDPDRITVAAIESFVYHITSQIRLIPRSGAQGAARRQRQFSGGITDSLVEVFRSRPDSLTDAQLWLLAYRKAVVPFLLDKKHPATRIHGQYEAKARILTSLVEVVDEGTKLQPVELSSLHKEIAVCWMHAGRLQLAVHHAARALSSHPAGAKIIGDPSFGGTMVDDDSVSAHEAWKAICDIRSVQAVLSMRQGRVLPEIQANLGPYFRLAQQIAKTGMSRRLDRQKSLARERGAIRIACRQADILLHSGDTSGSVKLFERAAALQRRVADRALDGEAARKYVVALVRLDSEGKKNQEKALELTLANIGRLSSYGSFSSDLIAFHVLRAGLFRVSGNIEEAVKALKDVEAHPFFRYRECTFNSLAELRLEQLRQGIVMGDDSTKLLERATRLIARTGQAHHAVLEIEARIVSAELVDGDERNSILIRTKSVLRSSGYRMRLSDIAEIERGGSAIRRFGF